MTDLFHFTCSHGREGIGTKGVLTVPPWPSLVWLTDLDAAPAEALGLTQIILRCDRTRYRYRVTDTGTCEPWLGSEARSTLGTWSAMLEAATGAMPRHWWISAEPVPVILSLPIEV